MSAGHDICTIKKMQEDSRQGVLFVLLYIGSVTMSNCERARS